MRVLITGGSGLIGRAVCEALVGRGDQVIGLSRHPEAAERAQPTVTWSGWEPMLERPAPDTFDGVDAVINLLGEKVNQRWSEESKRRIMESRRTGTHNLVATIASLPEKPAVLVSGSAIGYYGDRGAEVVDESSPRGEGFDADVVVAWERAAAEIQASGVRLVLVRTGHVLDPGGGLLGQLLVPFRLGLGGPIAGGRQYMSWVHIDDEVGIFLWALDEPTVSGVLNATAPGAVTNRELSKALGRQLGRPAIVPVPGLLLELIYGSEFGAVLQGGQRVGPKRTLELGFEFKHPDLDEALADLL